MSVIDRLRAVLAPLEWYDEDGDGYDIAPNIPDALTWHPAVHPRRFVAVLLRRVDDAGKGWTLRHMWRTVARGVRDAIMLTTEETTWLKKVTR